jgi:peptide/nickel transport system substrate-binding protein
MRKIVAGWMLPTLAALVLMTGCSKQEKYQAGETGGTLTVGLLVQNEPAWLNPLLLSYTASTDIQDKLFLRLHRFDKAMNIVPELARSWKFSEDFKELTYQLRRDVKWSDGRPVTAEDVVYTYRLMVDPKIRYARAGQLQFVESVEAVGPYAVKFTFNRVYSDELFDTGIFVLPKHALSEVSDLRSGRFDAAPVTDGPFILDQWNRGTSLSLVPNKAFYKGRPALDRIEFKFFADGASLLAAVQSGQIDVTSDLPPSEIGKLSGDASLKIIDYPGWTYTYLGWNLKNPMFAEAEMRRAFAMAINSSEMIQQVLHSKGKQAAGPLLPTSWAYDEQQKPLPYDPGKLKEALAPLGWREKNRDGYLYKQNQRQPLEITIVLAQGQPVQEAAAALIQKQMKELGIKVNLSAVDAVTFIQRVKEGRYDAMMFSWKNDYKVDPTAVWHSKPEKGRFNLQGYSNPEIDDLIDQGLATLSRRKAKELWVKFQRIISEEQPTTYLFVPDVVTVAYKGFRGPGSDERGPLASMDEWWIPSSERRGTALASASTATTPTATPTPTTAVPTPATAAPTAATPAPAQPASTQPRPTPAVAPAPAPANPQDILAAAAAPATPPPAAATSTPAPEPSPEPAVESGIPPTEPEVVKAVMPAYPEVARKAGITGRVFVRVVVAADGSIKSADVVRGIGGGCDEAALEAAKKMTFRPGTVDGKPAERPITIPFTFK